MSVVTTEVAPRGVASSATIESEPGFQHHVLQQGSLGIGRYGGRRKDRIDRIAEPSQPPGRWEGGNVWVCRLLA